MAFYDSPVRTRAAKAMDAVLALLIILLVVQLWLLTASVELWLAGHQKWLCRQPQCRVYCLPAAPDS